MSPLKYYLKFVYTQVPSKESHPNVGEGLGNQRGLDAPTLPLKIMP